MRRIFIPIWKLLAGGALVLLVLNLSSWDSGFGYRPDWLDLELRYGWPAHYRADWWRSTDHSSRAAFFASAFWSQSGPGLELKHRSFGFFPAAIDLAFAAALLVAIGALAHSRAIRQMTRTHVALLLVAVGVIYWFWSIASEISVYL